jgi:acetyltransferase-like isoleucine patch superfamily enzyme
MAGGEGVFVHAQGLCESARVGDGTRVWAFAHVMEGAEIGRECNICGHSFIETGARLGDRVVIKNGVQVWDGVSIEDDVFVGPNATFTNDLKPRATRPRETLELLPTRVERGATLGANVTIVCGHVIGREAFVAAGAVVTRDVAANALVAGNPARRVAWVCGCGERLADDLACGCGRRYRLRNEHEGLEPAS